MHTVFLTAKTMTAWSYFVVVNGTTASSITNSPKSHPIIHRPKSPISMCPTQFLPSIVEENPHVPCILAGLCRTSALFQHAMTCSDKHVCLCSTSCYSCSQMRIKYSGNLICSLGQTLLHVQAIYINHASTACS